MGKLSLGKLLAYGVYSFFILSFAGKIYANLFHPEFVIDSLKYSFYASMEPTTALQVSTIGNLFFIVVAVKLILGTYSAD